MRYCLFTNLQGDEDGKPGKDDKTREEERARAAAFKLAGWPEGGPRLVKLLRAEWASIRTVESMFSKVLYVANLRTVRSLTLSSSACHSYTPFEQLPERMEAKASVTLSWRMLFCTDY